LRKGWRRADTRFVVPYMITVVAGLILGPAVGRWWTLLAAGVGVWIGVATGVDEAPPWLLGAAYATPSAP
jgi:hypothetical protein